MNAGILNAAPPREGARQLLSQPAPALRGRFDLLAPAMRAQALT